MIKKMDKGARPIRSRKHRRSWTPVQGEFQKPIKRLFTPEIKRMLKDWLVRRRENPYPSRDEKKSLAQKTGLTYIQICNWFANWRRKLKNAGKEPQKKTWGNLIKNYNNNARGNVEQFSICSNDSIWEDEERRNDYLESKFGEHRDIEKFAHAIYYNDLQRLQQLAMENRHQRSEKLINAIQSNDGMDAQSPGYTNFNQINTVDNTTDITVMHMNTNQQVHDKHHQLEPSSNQLSNAKYKNQIMEKYLRGLDSTSLNKGNCGLELSKWLESAAKFTPEKTNYIEWNSKRIRSKQDEFQEQYSPDDTTMNIHQKEELDAAEALTFLAGNCKNRWIK